MPENEAIQVTVATSLRGRPGAILRAQVWNADGEDHAEVRYECRGECFALSGAEALAFLTVVAQDAAGMFAQTPPDEAGGLSAPSPRRQAGF